MELKGIYTADAHRYDDSEALYQRCGKSGVLLPKISLGFWHNFGGGCWPLWAKPWDHTLFIWPWYHPFLLSVGSGTAHRPLSQWHTCRQPYGKGAFPKAECLDSGTVEPTQEMECPSLWTQRDLSRDGFGLDPVPKRSNKRVGRRQLFRAIGEEYEMCSYWALCACLNCW